MTQTYQVRGIHCASCASLIKRTISRIPEITSCEVNSVSQQAVVTFSNKPISLSSLNSALKKFGYEFININTSQKPSSNVGLIIIMSLTIFTIVQMLVAMIFPNFHLSYINYLLFIFASYSLLIPGRKYLISLLRFVRFHVANMDTLVGLSTLTAYIYSSVNLSSGHTYFDAVIATIAFVSFGKFLENRSKSQTQLALSNLVSLQSNSATVLVSGKPTELPLESLHIGDIVIVKAGQKIPIDGQIVEGSITVDQSLVTGESLPVVKRLSSTVNAATLVTQGYAHIKATKIGSETLLGQIINQVQLAQNSHTQIERLADKISSLFVPIVLIFALLSALVWYVSGNTQLALVTFISVLVIACPCAMGLATPAAVATAVGTAAKMGILIKNAHSLEKFNQIDYVVFDKTGTLTQGKPSLAQIISTSKFSSEEILKLAASLESKSSHPLSHAIVSAIENSDPLFQVSNFKNNAGVGISGNINSRNYSLVSLNFAKTFLTSDILGQIDSQVQKGFTPILLISGKKLLGYLLVSDPVKSNAIEIIKSLHNLGLKTLMLTGDNLHVANQIANKLGISNVAAEVLPTQKTSFISDLQSQGHKVLMIGDGINDAAALSTADVSLAMSTGSDIAIQAADMTLLSGDLSLIPKSIALSNKTLKIIKQNLFWAFIYNLIAIPIAAGVLYQYSGLLLNPAIASAAMALSSVSVVLNSLRLKKLN